jgi:L-lactate dehydrogenase complex protein LldF
MSSTASFRGAEPFPKAATTALANPQLRRNLARATGTIRRRRNAVIGELEDFEGLRRAAAGIKDDALGRLGALLGELEARVTEAGGHVHFARDAAEARAIVTALVVATGEREVVKVKSMTTAEIELNGALEAVGIDVKETDLAELIVQLGEDLPSHIVVPAIHRNRAEIRATFLAEMGKSGLPAPAELTDEPKALATAARAHLRDRFLRAKVAISGANFAVAETGSLVVVESEGNGRMCLTLPETLISVVGIDKVIPTFGDLDVFLQVLARSATGERMNPYTSIWTGVSPGDGPKNVHLVLLDNGRSDALADRVGRDALRCIRCAACLNVCPVYERVGGHAYGSVYPGPIGAILSPQLHGVVTDPVAASLPFASTLCGACYEVCPVRIDIPSILVHLRGERVDAQRRRGGTPESAAMRVLGWIFASASRLRWAEQIGGIARGHRFHRLPGPLARWTAGRDAPSPAAASFRSWWRGRPGDPGPPGTPEVAAVRRERPIQKRSGLPGLGHRTSQSRRELGRRSPDARSATMTAIAAAHTAAPPVHGAVDRSYRDPDLRAEVDVVELLVGRLRDYRADVVVVDAAGLAPAVAHALARTGATRVVTAPDLPESWTADAVAHGAVVERDDGALDAATLDAIDATVSAVAVAVADTGTIILDGGAGQGRRIISLMPDHLVLVVDRTQIVAALPEAVARLRPAAPQTWISGPSATSDIELERVEGVHGPRVLDVVVVR